MEALSKTDKKILSLLQKDGRMSVAEIGRRVDSPLHPAPIVLNDSRVRV